MSAHGYRAYARRVAEKYGLNPHVFVRQINAESGFNPNARSGAGAVGIAQIMPDTAAGWGVNPSDPRAALDAAARHMAGYVHKYGSYHDALVAYNAGPGRVGRPLLPETAAYIQNILGGSDPGGLSKPSAATPGSHGSTKYIPAKSGQNMDAALVDSLLDPASNGHLLQSAMTRLESGAYDTQTPARAVKVQGSPKTAAPGGTSAPAPTKGTTQMDGYTIAAWMQPALAYARAHGWSGKIISGVRSREKQAALYAIYVASGFNPAHIAAKPGTSNHEIEQGGAVDVTDPAGLNRALSGFKGRKPIWGGPVIGDYPHFSVNGH